MQKPSYIYGTMHVSGKLAFNLNDSFFLGIKNCDFIVLEIDPDLMLSGMANSKVLKAFYTANSYLYQGNQGFYEYSFLPKELNNRMLANFLAQRNDMVNSLLYRSNMNTANKEEDTYLDLFIYQAGRKLGKKTFGLETFDGSMEMYAQSLKAENEMTEQERNQQVRREGLYSIEKLEDAYRKGDLVLIDSISRNTSSKMSYKYMVVERNKIMYHGIDSLIQAGAAVFTGVGAAHLGGEEGILNMLRKNGYTVNPVSWKGLKPSKHKSQIEKLVTTTQLSQQYSNDSSFSVEVPGKIHSLLNVGQDDTYLSTDMSNGSYYMISKINHNGFINKHDKHYWSKKVDSLIYENIDGSISKKQQTTTDNGDLAYLITSKTRRGDIERYKIVITSFNIVLFKVAGNGSYASGKEATQFLNSAKLYPQVSYDQQSSPFTYRFTQKNVFIENNPRDNRSAHLAMSEDGTKYNLLLVIPNTSDNYIEEDTFELNYIIDKAAERNKAEVTRIQISPDKTNAQFEWKKDNEVFKGKLIVNGAHYYFLLDNSGDEAFIHSFTLQPKQAQLTFKDFTDTSMLFKVKLVDSPDRNEFASILEGSGKKKPTDPLSKRDEFTSKTTKETISLSFERLNQYKTFTNLDSLWSSALYDATNLADPKFERKTYSKKNGAQVLDCEIASDLNANQYIRVKIVHKGKYIYTLKTLCAKGNTSAFIDTFYNTFSVLDSNYGLSATEPKTELLLTNLFASDSTTRADARESLYYLNDTKLKAGDFKLVKDAIQRASQSDMLMTKRITLIKSLESISTPECTNWLKSNYSTLAKDTPAYQFAILHALAGQHTMASTTAFAELIKKETPIVDEVYTFNNCINQFYDSLELVAKVAPQLMFLLDYDEYKERVIQLLSELKTKNLLSTNVYVANKSSLLNSANIETKKHIASIQSKSKEDSYNDYSDYIEDEYFESDNSRLTIDTNVSTVYFDIIYDYAILLVPFYQEPNIKSWFDKIIKNAEPDLQLSVGALLLKNKIAVEDSHWERWAANTKTRTSTYKLLNTIGRLDKFPSAFKNLDSIARSQVFKNNDEKENADSVMLVLKEEKVYSKKGMGTLYVYKQHNAKKNSWKWSFVYLKDEGNFDIRRLSSTSFENKLDEITDQKILDKIRLSIRVLNRNNCEEVNFYTLAREDEEIE